MNNNTLVIGGTGMLSETVVRFPDTAFYLS